jgi:hypothetical protein
VVAENLAGRSSTHSDTVTIEDSIAVAASVNGAIINPLTSVLYNGTSWNNASTGTVVRHITITFPEWMKVTTTPTISWAETGGDATALPSGSVWEWLTRTTGRFVTVVPASTNWSGDTPTIDISDLEDSSGNAPGENATTIDIKPTNGGGGGQLAP